MQITTATTPQPVFGHPLEVLPWFRRIPQSFARDVLLTLILSAVTALAFSLITYLNARNESLRQLLLINSVFSLCVGYSIHLISFAVGRSLGRWLPTMNPTLRASIIITAAVFAGAFGYWLGSMLLGLNFRFWSGMMIVTAWVSAVMTGIAMTQRKLMMSQLELERERTARVEAQRLQTVAHLKMLQAQIEPHFLFNTLANVSSLIDADPKRARVMLDQFTLLLRALLDQTRQSSTTLRKELSVAEAYLAVLKIRMGQRLTYSIDAPVDLIDTEVPTMLLQPLVENAVKHGIEPLVDGGTVCITAACEGDQLLLSVLDNGVGFPAKSKESIGLGAIRERLAVQFGAKANLGITRTPEEWTAVTIRIPMPSSNQRTPQ